MEEINFIRPQEVYDRNTGESKVRYTSYDGSNKFIPVVDGENGVPRTLVVTTHAELKAMRDAGKLTAGALYRITDYQCTTTQEGTRSAGHQFDIVLLALSNNKLAEEGWAMMHENIYDVTFADGTRRRCYLYLFKNDDGEQYNIVYADTLIGVTGYIEDGDIVNIDEENKTASVNLIQDFETENLTYNYFQNSNLSAWKVWYCLDNDTSRFAWADSENGRGVIYRMIDEWNNDVPYDFKNIQFKRKVNEHNVPDVQAQDEEYFYTFSLINNDDNYKILDASIFAKHFLNDENGEGRCNSNYISSIDEYTAGFSNINKFTLSNIILVCGVTQYDSTSFIVYNRFECCHSITLLGNNSSLTFSNSSNINCEDFIDIYNIIVLNTWYQIISTSWSNNIIHMERQTLKKVSFVNL